MSPAGSPDESTAGRADAASDRDLLTRFVRRQDERAFAEIVGRYGGLVLGVCRRVLSDTHSAEDAFQATFLVLARSARKIRKRRSLAAWLHGVALRVSTRALANRKRRREKQCEVPDVTADPLADISTLYEQQMLDEQLQHLPEKYREPLVLHYLQGQSQQQVAEQLGLSVTALEGRLRRGRHELRRRLVRTGVGLGAALTAAHVASSTASAGSASLQPLIASTAKAAVAHAPSQVVTTLVSQEAASLAGKELAMIAASKVVTTVGLSSAAVALVLVGIGAAGVGDSPSDIGGNGAAAVVIGEAFGPAEDGGAVPVRLAQVIDAGAAADPAQTAEQIEMKLLRDQIDQLQQALDTSRQFAAADLKPRDARTALIEATLEKPATLEFPANPIKDVVDFLSEAHKIPILLDEVTLSEAGVTPDQEISLVISQVSLRNALEIMLENVGGAKLDYIIDHQVLTITTREKADQTLDTRVYSLRALENSGFDSYSVANVIRKTIEPASWAHIEIVPEQGAADVEGMMGMGMAPGAGGMSMGGMGSGMGPAGLGSMQINRTQSSGLGTIESLPGCLVITQCPRVHRAVADLLVQLKAQAAEPESSIENPAQAAILRALDAPTSVEYAGVPLKKVIGEFANRFGINFVIDDGRLGRAGVSSNAPVTISAHGISLRSVLTLILKDIGKGKLTFRINNQVLEITTVDDAGGAGPRQAQIERTLDSLLTVDYVGGTVLGALHKLEERFGVKLIMNESVLRNAGVDLDSPYSLVTGGVTLRNSFNQVLQYAGGGRLTYQVEDEGIRIALKADAGGSAPPGRPVPDADLDDGSSTAIRGTIRVRGELAPRPPLVPVVGNTPETRHLTDPIPDESVIVGPEGGLVNCIVYLDKLPGGLVAPPVPEKHVTFVSRDLRFVPHVLLVRAGQTIEIGNDDPIAINCHMNAAANPFYNGVLKPGARNEYSFGRAERAPVKVVDDIHPWMSAWILPLDHPWAAVSDENGHFEMPQLPSGEYTFKIWHEKAGYINRQLEVTVTADGAQEVELMVDHGRLENP